MKRKQTFVQNNDSNLTYDKKQRYTYTEDSHFLLNILLCVILKLLKYPGTHLDEFKRCVRELLIV